MRNIQSLCLTLTALAVLSFAFPAIAAGKAEKKTAGAGNQIVDSGWSKRCSEAKKDDKAKDDKAESSKSCEIFKRLGVKTKDKNAASRVAEFAVGFPPNDKGLKKGDARGVVILPLGILLDTGVSLKVDDEKPVSFKTRFCTNAGCVSFINISSDLLDKFKQGKNINFLFKSSDGGDVKLVMSLDGFGKLIKEIQ